MAWYDANYTHRIPIFTPNASGTATQDVQVSISPVHDYFWDIVQSTGYDVRFVSATGTVYTHERNGWNYSTQSATFNIDNVAYPSTNTTSGAVIYMYYGYAAAADTSSVFTPASPNDGYPGVVLPSGGRFIQTYVDGPNATNPSVEIAKTTVEEFSVFWDVTRLTGNICGNANGKRIFEEINGFDFTVEQSGTPVASMYGQDVNGYTECRGSKYIHTYLSAGTDANQYTALLTVYTAGPTEGLPPRTYDFRAKVYVRDPVE